ncbi:hypothetical protein Z043_112520 [Scleropages formosus]|uniref:Uncharacterized protein n=1 Tax=Scleropages formosus TaxID=113540 RepID=A0A0P7UKB5_SCLFO|nr:hypothetical protein Z043_112520 [Scleropages formosus]
MTRRDVSRTRVPGRWGTGRRQDGKETPPALRLRGEGEGRAGVGAMDSNPGPEEPQVEVLYKNYVPPARDAIHLPKHVLYLLIATLIVLTVLYAITGHLIKDLIHDLAGGQHAAQPEEAKSTLWETRDKFSTDWCPEITPELEELVREEEIKVVMEGRENMPAIWVIPDAREPRPARAVKLSTATSDSYPATGGRSRAGGTDGLRWLTFPDAVAQPAPDSS